MALLKKTSLGEGRSIEFRAEFFNVFNHAQFNGSDGNINDPTFGEVLSARDPRVGKVAIKVIFRCRIKQQES